MHSRIKPYEQCYHQSKRRILLSLSVATQRNGSSNRMNINISKQKCAHRGYQTDRWTDRTRYARLSPPLRCALLPPTTTAAARLRAARGALRLFFAAPRALPPALHCLRGTPRSPRTCVPRAAPAPHAAPPAPAPTHHLALLPALHLPTHRRRAFPAHAARLFTACICHAACARKRQTLREHAA